MKRCGPTLCFFKLCAFAIRFWIPFKHAVAFNHSFFIVYRAIATITACVVCAYTRLARPLPVTLRSLTAGYKASNYRFATELVLLLRKWLIMIAGISFQSAYWALLVCVLLHVALWFVLVRWKPFATYGSQFHGRSTQVLLLLFMV